MSNVEVEQEANTTDVASTDASVAIQPENVERRIYAVYKGVNEQGELVDFQKYEQVSVQDFEKWEGLEKNKYKVVATNKDGVPAIVTCKEYSVGALAGLSQLIGDETEAVSVANRGLSQKTSAGVLKELLATNEQGELTFDFAGGVFDTLEILQKISNRRLSPVEKAERDLKDSMKTLGIDPDMFVAFMRQMQAQS